MSLQTHAPAAKRKSAPAEGGISNIAIREFDLGTVIPTRTIRIPVKVFSLASTLVPRRIRDEMAKEGIDLDAILLAAREVTSPVTLVEVEEHQKGRKIVVSLE